MLDIADYRIPKWTIKKKKKKDDKKREDQQNNYAHVYFRFPEHLLGMYAQSLHLMSFSKQQFLLKF